MEAVHGRKATLNNGWDDRIDRQLALVTVTEVIAGTPTYSRRIRRRAQEQPAISIDVP